MSDEIINENEIQVEQEKTLTENNSIGFNINITVLCLILAVAVVTIYLQVAGFNFINFDDTVYVTENKHVQNGLSIEGIKWAFHLAKPGDNTYWHPLTWISLMLDNQLFGLDAGMYHISNVIYHVINAILLFIALWLYTRSKWKSFFVAVLFAIHPVNVDSVAWIAERKNLLSTLFWMLAFIAYYYYATKPNLSRYLLLFIIYTLGLLSKPMLVTLPFVLLLVDFWPLNRLSSRGERFLDIFRSLFCKDNIRQVIEKIPLLMLSLAFIFYNSRVISTIGASVSEKLIPVDLRIKNAIVVYSLYLKKCIWPDNLTIYYPFPKEVPMWEVFSSLALLLIITILVLRYIKKLPYLSLGWLWFVGTIVPVSGIMQGGLWPQIAERWAYIPFIGIFIIIAWGIPDLLNKVPKKEIVIGLSAASLVLAFSVKTWAQIGIWKDDFTLFRNAIRINNDSVIAHNNLGVAYGKNKELEKAIEHFNEALRIDPLYEKAYTNLGVTYSQQKKSQLAIENFEKGLKLNPYDANARFFYGNYLISIGKKEEGFRQLFSALELDPYNGNAQYQVGVVLAENGEYDKAGKHLEEFLRIEPNNVKVHYKLAIIYMKMHQNVKAIDHFNFVLNRNPDNANAHCGLGTVYTQLRKHDEAVHHFNEALRIDPKNTDAYCGLGSALSIIGKSGEAEKAFREAIKINPKNVIAYSGLGLVLAKKGNTQEALNFLNGALKIDSKNAVVYYELGTIYAGMGNTEEAIRNFKESLKVNPGYIFSLVNLGNIMLNNQNYDEAVGLYDEALKKDPHMADVCNNLGSAYFNKGNIKKAVEFYKKALQENPDYAKAADNLKIALENQKKFEELARKINEGIKANPQNFMLYTKLGDVYRLMGEFDKAAENYRKALSIQPRDLQAMNGLVLVYSSGQGDYVKAIDILQSMRMSQPGNPEIYYNIACIYAKQNRDEESIVWLRQAVDKGFRNWELIRKDPDLANVRDTSFVQGLMARK